MKKKIPSLHDIVTRHLDAISTEVTRQSVLDAILADPALQMIEPQVVLEGLQLAKDWRAVAAEIAFDELLAARSDASPPIDENADNMFESLFTDAVMNQLWDLGDVIVRCKDATRVHLQRRMQLTDQSAEAQMKWCRRELARIYQAGGCSAEDYRAGLQRIQGRRRQ